MPRERNTEEQKKRIKDTQRKNEKELEEITKKIYAEYGLRIEDKDFRNHKGLALKLNYGMNREVCALIQEEK